MNQTVSRYEYDKGLMKLSLFNENDENILYISLSHELNCCENFGMYIQNLNSKILNKRIQNIKVKQTRTEKEYSDGPKTTYTTTIKMDDDTTIKVVLYNEHNGYYTHDVNITYDDVNILDSI
jgi:hypothetical protein